MQSTLTSTEFNFPGQQSLYHGKVRDVYDINGDTLTVRAERHSEHEEKNKKGKYVRCERSYGSYSRDFDLSGVKADEIKAKYENGVLKLTMPKKTEALPESKHLEIE